MSLTLDGTNGVSLVQDGVITDANLPAGSVLQVVSATHDTAVSTTSTSNLDTGLTASITPSSTSSKIFVIVSQSFGVQRNDPFPAARLVIVRDGTEIRTMYWDVVLDLGSNERFVSPSSITILDSPSSTSSVSYKTQIACRHGTNSEVAYANNRSSEATITLMEIAG